MTELREALNEQSISTGIHYPAPVHQMPCYKQQAFANDKLPVTNELSATEISLPMCPMMTDEQVIEVCDARQDHAGET